MSSTTFASELQVFEMELYREAVITAIVTIILIIVLLWMYDLVYELVRRFNADSNQNELQLVPWGQNDEFERYQYWYRHNSRSTRSVTPAALQEPEYKPSLENEPFNGFQLTSSEVPDQSKATPRHCKSQQRYTPFLAACLDCDVLKIAYLIKKGVGTHQKTERGESGLLLATYKMAKGKKAWNPLCLDILFCNGCSINEPTVDGNTALHIAVKLGHTAATKWLLKHGASVYIENRAGWRPLTIAQAQRRQDIVHILQEAEYTQDNTETEDAENCSKTEDSEYSRDDEDAEDCSEYCSALCDNSPEQDVQNNF